MEGSPFCYIFIASCMQSTSKYIHWMTRAQMERHTAELPAVLPLPFVREASNSDIRLDQGHLWSSLNAAMGHHPTSWGEYHLHRPSNQCHAAWPNETSVGFVWSVSDSQTAERFLGLQLSDVLLMTILASHCTLRWF